MRTLLDKVVLGILLAIMGGIAVHAPVSVWLSTQLPEFELLIKSWKEIAMGFATVLLLISVFQKKKTHLFTRDKLLWLVGCIAVLHVVYLLIFNNNQVSEFAGLLIDLRFYLYFTLVYVYIRLRPQDTRLLILAFFAGAAVVAVFALLQVFVLPKDILAHIGYSAETIKPYLTVDLNQAYIRINSILRGPNPLGAYAVIVLSMIAALYGRKFAKLGGKRQLTVAVIGAGSLAALWWSYSRSAMLAAFVAALAFVAAVGFSSISRRVLVWGGSIVATGAILLSLVIAANPGFVSSVFLHENPNGGSAHTSNDGHVSSLVRGFEQSSSDPLGDGIGSTGSASLFGDEPRIIENQYLMMAHESGWLGALLQLAVFGWVLFVAWKNRQRPIALAVFASGIGMAAIGVVLPVWADGTVSLTWWGLAAVAMAVSINGSRKEKNERTSHKKAKRTT